MGELKKNTIFITIFSEIWTNIERIIAYYPNFDAEVFVEQTQKVQEIISDSRFETWKEIWILGKSCEQQVRFVENCIENIKTINLQEIIEIGENFDDLRLELNRGNL